MVDKDTPSEERQTIVYLLSVVDPLAATDTFFLGEGTAWLWAYIQWAADNVEYSRRRMIQ